MSTRQQKLLKGYFTPPRAPLERIGSCLIAVDQINAMTSRMAGFEKNAIKFNIKAERKFIPKPYLNKSS